jgi:hypothetical protein
MEKEKAIAHLERLKDDLDNTDDAKEVDRICTEIDKEKRTLSRLLIAERLGAQKVD